MRTHPCCLLLTLSACLPMGCVATHVGNPPNDDETVIAQVGMQAYETPNALTFGLGGELTEAWIVTESISLRSGPDCDQTSPIYQRRTTINLLTGEAYPPLPTAELPVGDYCGVQVFFDQGDPERADGAPTPDALAGRSVYFSGVSDGEPFVFTSIYEGTLDVEADTPFPLQNARESFMIGLNTQAWLISTLVGTLPEDLPDTPEVDEARAAILNVVFSSADLFRDGDDDGRIDLDELDDKLSGF